MTTKLYRTLTEITPRFGTFLAHDSSGKIVLEMKGTPTTTIEAFDPSHIEEVRPYTVAVTSGGSPKHFITKRGAVEKGDVIMTKGGQLQLVIRLDTKAAKVEGTLRGRKLMTEGVELPDNCPGEDGEDIAA